LPEYEQFSWKISHYKLLKLGYCIGLADPEVKVIVFQKSFTRNFGLIDKLSAQIIKFTPIYSKWGDDCPLVSYAYGFEVENHYQNRCGRKTVKIELIFLECS